MRLNGLIAGVVAVAALSGCAKEVPDVPLSMEANHMVSQAYWYSRYNFGAVVMTGGMGQEWDVPDSFVDKMVELSSDDLSTGNPFGWYLIDRVWDAGDPHYGSADDGIWASVSNKTTKEALGWVAMKESMWGKQFHVDDHFGIPGANDIPGAQQRFFGAVLVSEEFVQFLDYQNHPEAFDDDVAGHYVLLAAGSDFIDLCTSPTLDHSASNRYKEVLEFMAADLVAPTTLEDWSRGFADDLYAARPAPVTLRDHSYALYGLPWYAERKPAEAEAIRTEMAALGDAVLAMDYSSNLGDQALALRGLIEASRATGEARFTDAAETLLADMLADFDADNGVFMSTDTYDSRLMGDLFGALNSADLNLDAGITSDVITPAFEHLINRSGFQQAASGVNRIGSYERLPSADNVDEMFHRWPDLPTPREGDGANGIAPMFAGSVTYDHATNSWVDIDRNVDISGTMHLANEMIWFHSDEVIGFREF